MEYDWIGYAAAILIFMYSLWNDAQNRQKRNAASATLAALKPSVQGPNKDKIIAAIDDTFWSASSELSARSWRLPGQFRGARHGLSICKETKPAQSRNLASMSVA